MFKKLLAVLLLASSCAWADYKFIVPQEPGGGTSSMLKPVFHAFRLAAD
jgi:hypothetical protein